jgi:hypothetical protein
MSDLPKLHLFEVWVAKKYPWIPWREPISISTPGRGSGLGCRICIAHVGIKGWQVETLPQTREEFQAHLDAVHLGAAG